MDALELDNQIEELEISIDNAKSLINKADDLDKLINNKEFKSVILDGYFKDEASRLVLTKASPDMADPEIQKDINNAITAIGYLRRHFSGIRATGQMARKSLHEAEQTREEMLSEAAQ